MDKQHILDEIRRTAEANGGVALGWRKFAAETGIIPADFEKHWARWGDAVREAGVTPNEMTRSYTLDQVLEKYADFAGELQRLPTPADLRFQASSDADFPAEATFRRHGTKPVLVRKVREFCLARSGYDTVSELCDKYLAAHKSLPVGPEHTATDIRFGFVYLLKSGRNYKIGHSNSAGRRQYELKIQLPDAAELVHEIRTDDPPGIEAYWHKRFDAKRKNGEWFYLTAADVAAFKRRKFM